MKSMFFAVIFLSVAARENTTIAIDKFLAKTTLSCSYR